MSKTKRTVEFTHLVRVDCSFPNVDEATRLQISKVLYDKHLDRFGGGGGDGNSSVFYIPANQVDWLREKLLALGFSVVPDVVDEEVEGEG